jgi:Mrp family chromosome partitioning ATPase
MAECDHNCEGCGEECSERKESLIEKTHELSSINKVIAIVSGKGGVGKSLVTGLLSVETSRNGSRCAILDADITGPSVPKMFGIKSKANGEDKGINPAITKSGIKVISSNMLLENETDPVIWRGPMIAGMVKQFWSEVMWGDVDYMFIDMPPGTGDVPLTVFQSVKVDGIIIVTSPQELVSMIVEKAVNMAQMMNIPIYGIVENMSYLKCKNCGEIINVFGESHIEEVAKKHNIEVLGKLPIDSEIASLCDKGNIESYKENFLSKAVNKITK